MTKKIDRSAANKRRIMGKGLWNAFDLAVLTGLSYPTIKAEVATGNIPGQIIGDGKRRMYTRSDLETFLGEDATADILGPRPPAHAFSAPTNLKG